MGLGFWLLGVAGPASGGFISSGNIDLGGGTRTFTVTDGAAEQDLVVNVPMNNRLDSANPVTDQGAAIWAYYLSRWTAWNHVRALACTAAVAALTVGIWV